MPYYIQDTTNLKFSSQFCIFGPR